MAQDPLLLLDCDLIAGFGTDLFRPWLNRANAVAVQAPHEVLPDSVAGWSGVVLTGSAAAVHDHAPWSVATTALLRRFVDAGVPVLGVCYGHQLLGEAVGGRGTVRRRAQPEVGYHEVVLQRGDPLFDALPERFRTFLSHGDEVVGQPGFQVMGHSEACAVQAIRVPGKPAWGVQFHTEYSPEAQLALLQKRQRLHPEMGYDAQAMFEARTDTAGQAAALFDRFLEIAGW